MEKLVFKNLNIELSHDPTIPLLVIYPTELKTYAQTVFIAELFIMAKVEAALMASTDEWINKKQYIYTTEYYLTIKGIKY